MKQIKRYVLFVVVLFVAGKMWLIFLGDKRNRRDTQTSSSIKLTIFLYNYFSYYLLT
jgi:hypothetical protein